jgi:dTDP-4-dehydrorhamnose 3,5-epimerase-like enzyme
MKKSQRKLCNGYHSFSYAKAMRGFFLNPEPEKLVRIVQGRLMRSSPYDCPQ